MEELKKLNEELKKQVEELTKKLTDLGTEITTLKEAASKFSETEVGYKKQIEDLQFTNNNQATLLKMATFKSVDQTKENKTIIDNLDDYVVIDGKEIK